MSRRKQLKCPYSNFFNFYTNDMPHATHNHRATAGGAHCHISRKNIGLKVNLATEQFSKYQFGLQTINGLILATEQIKWSILATRPLENTKMSFLKKNFFHLLLNSTTISPLLRHHLRPLLHLPHQSYQTA